MERIVFNEIENLGEYMIHRVHDKGYVVAALFFDEATELMRYMLKKCMNVGAIEIAHPKFCGYDDVYYVSISDNFELCVEMALCDGKYLYTGAPLLLVDEYAKHAIVVRNDDSECIAIAIGECEDDDCCECDACEDHCDHNDDDGQMDDADVCHVTLDINFETLLKLLFG